MANRCDPLDKISPVRECWRVKVRVVRLWHLPSFNNSDVINSMEMVFMDEFVGFYAVYVTINTVNQGPDWWFAACKCGEQVTVENGRSFCKKCNKHVLAVIPRYRIKLRVMDSTDSATFVLWDHIGCRMLKRSCSDMLVAATHRIEETDEFKNLLLEKSLIFKVEVKEAGDKQIEPAFNVIDFCDDVEIISKFKELDSGFINPEPDMTAGVSLGDNSLSLEFHDVQSSSVVKDLMSEFGDGNSIAFSQSEGEVPSFTPAKRVSDAYESQEDGDLSTRRVKTVKLEKD